MSWVSSLFILSHATSVFLTYPKFYPVVSPTGSRPPSRNWNNEMPGDEELGFEAAVAALGESVSVLSTSVS